MPSLCFAASQAPLPAGAGQWALFSRVDGPGLPSQSRSLYDRGWGPCIREKRRATTMIKGSCGPPPHGPGHWGSGQANDSMKWVKSRKPYGSWRGFDPPFSVFKNNSSHFFRRRTASLLSAGVGCRLIFKARHTPPPPWGVSACLSAWSAYLCSLQGTQI